MSTSTVGDLIESHSPPTLIPAPKGVIKGQPLHIAIFGINLNVLMRIQHSMIEMSPNIAMFGIKLKVFMRTSVLHDINEPYSLPIPPSV